VHSQNGWIRIQIDSAIRPMSFPVLKGNVANRGRILEEAKVFVQAFEALVDLSRRAGVFPERPAPADAVIEHGREALALQKIAAGGPLEPGCPEDTAAILLESQSPAIIVASSLSLGAWAFVFYGVADVSERAGASGGVSIHNFRFRALRQIRTEVKEFNQFVDAAARSEGITQSFTWEAGKAVANRSACLTAAAIACTY
jgi:hypothetical protein